MVVFLAKAGAEVRKDMPVIVAQKSRYSTYKINPTIKPHSLIFIAEKTKIRSGSGRESTRNTQIVGWIV